MQRLLPLVLLPLVLLPLVLLPLVLLPLVLLPLVLSKMQDGNIMSRSIHQVIFEPELNLSPVKSAGRVTCHQFCLEFHTEPVFCLKDGGWSSEW